MSSVDEILAKLEELSTKIGYIQADIHALRQDIDEVRSESRKSNSEMRADLARFVNRFTTAVDDAKKKPTGTLMQSNNSSGALQRLTMHSNR